jgi:hypothetical protein
MERECKNLEFGREVNKTQVSKMRSDAYSKIRVQNVAFLKKVMKKVTRTNHYFEMPK